VSLTHWVLAAAVAWFLTAPDPVTASVRAGAGGALASGARAAGRSIGADMKAASARRTAKHQARLARWAGRGDRTGRALVALDRVFGRGGVVEAAGKRAATHGRVALEAGRVGWQESRTRGRRGLPAPIRERMAGRLPGSSKARGNAGPASDQTKTSPASSGGKKEAAVTPQNGKKNWPEITGTPTLRGEAKELSGEIAGAEQHLKVINGWLDSIEVRYAAAAVGTKHVGIAIQGATATRKGAEEGMKALTALGESLAQLRKALDAADLIGDVAAEQDAKGDVKGFQAA